jgi:ABC-type sugar transport system permease subunit
MKRTASTNRFVAVFLAPAVLLYSLFVVLPALNALKFSTFRWDGLSKPVFVGLVNFQRILANGSLFVTALKHNLFLTIAPGCIILVLALFFAFTIHQEAPGARIFRVAFFFPNVMSSVAVALLWVLIYSTSSAGLINNLLAALSHAPVIGGYLHHTTSIPFTQSSTLLWALVPMIVWTATGFYMVLFLAAMENIPETYYEAARLDGAGTASLFRFVTLPLMWDVLTTGVVFLVVGGLKAFDAIWIMENGRPGADTHTMSTLMYTRVFEDYNIGYGCAITVLLFLLVLVATLVSLRLMKRERLEY